MSTQKNIQQSLLAAMRDIATTGIAKRLKADLGGARINFRGIEDAMNDMCAVLIRCGITVTPEYSDLNIMERAKGDPKDGKAMRFATVKGTFTFQAEDMSAVRCICYGEAADSGDKAVTKAQSISFRTALFQQFIVPTQATAIDPESDPEGDSAPDAALDAAEAGMAAYQAYWGKLKPPEKKSLEPHHEGLKKIAQEADKRAAAEQGGRQ